MVLLFCCFSFQITAQFSFGISGGTIKAWERYGISLPEDAKIHVNGYYVSSLVYFEISKLIRVGVEPGFVQRGAACIPEFQTIGPGTFIGDTRLLLDYIELPLMISARIPICNKLEVLGKAGYGPSVMITAFQEILFISSSEPITRTKLDINPFALRRYDHGIYSGLGLAFNIGDDKVFLESNYYFGLNDVDPFNTSKNRSIQLGLG